MPVLPRGASEADPDHQPSKRTFGETRRRTKVIPRFSGEQACLTLLFATLITAAEKWRGVRMTPQIIRALGALRAEVAHRKEQAAA